VSAFGASLADNSRGERHISTGQSPTQCNEVSKFHRGLAELTVVDCSSTSSSPVRSASEMAPQQPHDWPGAKSPRCDDSFLGEITMCNHLATVHHVNRTLLMAEQQAAGPSDGTPVKPTKKDVAAMAEAGTLERQARLLGAWDTHLGAPSRDVQPRPAPSALPAKPRRPLLVSSRTRLGIGRPLLQMSTLPSHSQPHTRLPLTRWRRTTLRR